MPDLSALAAAADKYPEIVPFLSFPGVMDVLLQAIAGQWTPDVLDNHLKQTPYWKSTTDAARKWDVLHATDPATADQQWKVGQQHLANMRTKLGVNLNSAQFQMIAAQAIRNGWSDETITTAMLGVHNGGPLPAGGDLGAALSQIRGLAADYGVSVSDHAKMVQARRLLMGGVDAQGLADQYQGWAANKYANNTAVVDALHRGITVKEYADPFIQEAVQELGVNPADIDFRQAKWNSFLTEVNPDTKAGMTLADWTRKIRTDPRFGYNSTAGAADQAAQLTSALAKEFGAQG